jgi:serine/threonine-protein kinase
MAMLPKGYDSGACKATAPISDAVATVDCKQNSLAGGPDSARYVLFKDATTLAEKFASSIKQDESLFACPGGSDMSPTKWYQDNPNSPLGQIACGTYKNKPDLVWTYDSKLFYADVQGSDMNALFEWWKTNA